MIHAAVRLDQASKWGPIKARAKYGCFGSVKDLLNGAFLDDLPQIHHSHPLAKDIAPSSGRG